MIIGTEKQEVIIDGMVFEIQTEEIEKPNGDTYKSDTAFLVGFEKGAGFKKLTIPKFISVAVNDLYSYTVFVEGIRFKGYSDVYIEELIISDGIKEIIGIDFAERDIKSVKLPYSLNYIGDLAFYNNKNLIVEIPERIEYIGTGAFTDCKGIKLPENYDISFNYAYADGCNVTGLRDEDTATLYRGGIKGHFRDDITCIEIPTKRGRFEENKRKEILRNVFKCLVKGQD